MLADPSLLVNCPCGFSAFPTATFDCDPPRLSRSVLLFFFFFQAEDGIRDIGVTGVQTCALPISCTRLPTLTRWRLTLPPIGANACVNSMRPLQQAFGLQFRGLCRLQGLAALIRSEERRVGKECRSRWSPYH